MLPHSGRILQQQLHLTHMKLTTNVNAMALYDYDVQFLYFDSVLTKSVTVKATIYYKKNPQNCIFLVECQSQWSL